jgi:DNA-directed RNA polymerase subunit N (RpoN/RPB10)
MKFERFPCNDLEIYKHMSPQHKVQVSLDLHELNRIWARLEVRHEHPEWDELGVQRETARRMFLDAGLPADHLLLIDPKYLGISE